MRAFPVVAVFLTALTAFCAFLPERSGTLAFWAFACGPTIVLAGVGAWWALREDLLREWLRPAWGDATRGVLGAIGLYGAGWAFVHTVTPVGSPREIWLVTLYGQIGDPRTLQANATLVAVVIVCATLAEEVVWRGVVTQLLAERVGSRTAWIWAAALYAAAFAPTMLALRASAGLNPILCIAALGGALVWGGLARASGTLVSSVVAHALFDWAVLMMARYWGRAG